jgi:hypothetical protein
MGPGICVSIIQAWIKHVQKMNTLCLAFARLLIPQQLLNSYHFWTRIRVIIKSASQQTTKRKHHLLCRSEFSVTPRWHSGWRMGGAAYQKCVHIILENQIGRNVEAYIDDIVVKSKNMGICLTTLTTHSTISVSTKWYLILKMRIWHVIREAARLYGIV